MYFENLELNSYSNIAKKIINDNNLVVKNVRLENKKCLLTKLENQQNNQYLVINCSSEGKKKENVAIMINDYFCIKKCNNKFKVIDSHLFESILGDELESIYGNDAKIAYNSYLKLSKPTKYIEETNYNL